MTANIFIDGEVGTTGLQIRTRLEGRSDLSLVHLDDDVRKDKAARASALNGCDIAILCLPDDAARDAVALIDNPDVRVIDASSAHRTAADWVYGFAELDGAQGEKIATAKRVSNPGCYAVSSVAMVRPLVDAGLLATEHGVCINAISGYSGGGKGLIADFEVGKDVETPFFVYGLGLDHKHVPEIQAHGALSVRPLLVPSVGHFAQGMIAQLPLPGFSGKDVHDALSAHYTGRRFVTVAPLDESANMNRLEPESLNGTNELRLYVLANEKEGHAVVMALVDNLGKGASGSAVQNLNLMLGMDEGTGL